MKVEFRFFPGDILHLLFARLSPVYLSDVGDIYKLICISINQLYQKKVCVEQEQDKALPTSS